MIPNEWPPERIAELTRLFNDGLSFAQIASYLALTRMAVIGKCNRLGLRRVLLSKVRSDGAKAGHLIRKLRCDPTKNKTFNKLVAGPKFNSVELPPPLESDLAIPKRQRKQIATLGPRDCKYPIGTPGEPDFFFCAACRAFPLPYCPRHCAVAYYPAKGRNDAPG
jgi:GcrA cell cycle regulator